MCLGFIRPKKTKRFYLNYSCTEYSVLTFRTSGTVPQCLAALQESPQPAKQLCLHALQVRTLSLHLCGLSLRFPPAPTHKTLNWSNEQRVKKLMADCMDTWMAFGTQHDHICWKILSLLMKPHRYSRNKTDLIEEIRSVYVDCHIYFLNRNDCKKKTHNSRAYLFVLILCSNIKLHFQVILIPILLSLLLQISVYLCSVIRFLTFVLFSFFISRMKFYYWAT